MPDPFGPAPPNNFIEDLLTEFGIVAHPSQRPGPAGSVIENVQRGSPTEANVNLRKGNNVIEVGPNVPPTTLTHEVGHVDQNEGNSRLFNIAESASQFGGSLARGSHPHDPRLGMDRERSAPSQGMQAVIDAAQGGDPDAQRLMDQMKPETRQRLLETRPEQSAQQNFIDDVLRDIPELR